MISVSSDDRALLRKHLQDFSESQGIEILMAVALGSRAWGLESAASDFDIKVIFRYPPKAQFTLRAPEEVLSEKTVMEFSAGPVDVDITGWSLSKTLGLASASNPQLSEILRCPLRIMWDYDFEEQLKTLADQASLRTMANYYRGNAKKNAISCLEGKRAPTPKTVLQILRGMMMAERILETRKFPTIAFDELSDLTFGNDPSGYSSVVGQLAAFKRGQVSEPPQTQRLIAHCSDRIEALDLAISQTLPHTFIPQEEVDRVWMAHYPEIFCRALQSSFEPF